MRKILPLVLCCASACCVFPATRLQAQAVPTATRSLSFQVGIAGSSYALDYGPGREEGLTLYGDADLTRHFGAEVLYREASLNTPHDLGENHFLIGPRAHITRGRFTPYTKFLIGLGTIKYELGFYPADSSASYFIYALGGGLDVRATRHITIRAIDFEYQRWPGFRPNGLTPTGLSVGAAYRF